MVETLGIADSGNSGFMSCTTFTKTMASGYPFLDIDDIDCITEKAFQVQSLSFPLSLILQTLLSQQRSCLLLSPGAITPISLLLSYNRFSPLFSSISPVC